jgi:hypothetical protein
MKARANENHCYYQIQVVESLDSLNIEGCEAL